MWPIIRDCRGFVGVFGEGVGDLEGRNLQFVILSKVVMVYE